MAVSGSVDQYASRSVSWRGGESIYPLSFFFVMWWVTSSLKKLPLVLYLLGSISSLLKFFIPNCSDENVRELCKNCILQDPLSSVLSSVIWSTLGLPWDMTVEMWWKCVIQMAYLDNIHKAHPQSHKHKHTHSNLNTETTIDQFYRSCWVRNECGSFRFHVHIVVGRIWSSIPLQISPLHFCFCQRKHFSFSFIGKYAQSVTGTINRTL